MLCGQAGVGKNLSGTAASDLQCICKKWYCCRCRTCPAINIRFALKKLARSYSSDIFAHVCLYYVQMVHKMHVIAPGKVHYKHKQGRWQSDIMMRLPGGEGWPTSSTRLLGRSPWQKVIWHSGPLPAKPAPPRLNCFLNAAIKIHQISWVGQQTPVAIIVHLALWLKLRKP